MEFSSRERRRPGGSAFASTDFFVRQKPCRRDGGAPGKKNS